MAHDRDMRDELEQLFDASHGRFDIVDVPELGYISATGHGGVHSEEYQRTAEAVSVVARTVRQIVLERFGFTHVVAPLETLWTTGAQDADRGWMISIAQPDWVDRATVSEAIDRAAHFSPWLDLLPSVRYEQLTERRSVQTLHVGPVDTAESAFRRLVDEFLPSQRLLPTGMRHEIYLTNPRTTVPAEMRTILRQPVRAMRVPEPSEFTAETVSA